MVRTMHQTPDSRPVDLFWRRLVTIAIDGSARAMDVFERWRKTTKHWGVLSSQMSINPSPLIYTMPRSLLVVSASLVALLFASHPRPKSELFDHPISIVSSSKFLIGA
ncbi:hypothetical protein HPP92_027153 [Vanilla planifolia]|uniref:Uncharacterized protein n=1 Tax=Vanilla planifolia TaxID=51239 RepID=A0A835P9W7_VANPL|nr:hypothetical protein HPP92_027153 [Vanilla planifolia]